MGPPPAPIPKAQGRLSQGSALNKSTRPDPSGRPSRSAGRPSFINHRQDLSTSREQSQTRSVASEGSPISPSIEEEEREEERAMDRSKITSIPADGHQKPPGPEPSPGHSQVESAEAPRSNLPANGTGSTRTKQENTPALNKELEQMRAKYKIMEKKRMEDRDKLKALETMKSERDKFEITMQKLQRKCQTQSQEIAECRKQLQASEARVEELERADAEHGTEVEMATLDKEMAEERLEAATAELEILKERCEELELEAEIMRDENKELTSGMSSEERSSAGWLQMEKENHRLRDALMALRDMTQETETTLKSHVKELESDLGQFETIKSENEKMKSDLAASNTAIKTLKQNLDAADDQELVVAQLTEEKDVLTEQIRTLSKDVMALKEDLEVSRQLQEAQDETEKLLQEDLDAVRAYGLERDQKTKDQAKVIDDLEYTLVRFKEVLSGLQSDLVELRASKQLNESEANELNAKSRAMMDLNLRLQSTAAKNHTKKIELELTQVNSEDTALHLEIIRNFVPETFKDEKGPILALLRFKRIASKASLLRGSMEGSIGQTADTALGDPFTAFDVIEKLQWVWSCCSRCHSFMTGCTVEDFSNLNTALDELEPVERAIDKWIDAVKRQEMDVANCVQDLQRMIALLSDLAEKTVPSVPEMFADTFTGMTKMVQLYTEHAGLELGLIEESVRNKIVSRQDDEEFLHFSRKIREFVERSRTCRVMAGKVLYAVGEQRNHSMTLGETSMTAFEQAESFGKQLSGFSRAIRRGILQNFSEDHLPHDAYKFEDVSTMIQKLATDWLKQSSLKVSGTVPALETIGDVLSALHAKLDVLVSMASDLSKFSEFERHPSPWTVRAKILREQKIVDKDIAEQLRKLQAAAREHSAALSAKDKSIEEQSLKLELLEARSKGTKDHTAMLQKLEKDLAEAVKERDQVVSELTGLTKEMQALTRKYEEASTRLAKLIMHPIAGDSVAAARLASVDESASHQLAIDMGLLKEDVANLQSAVRFLKAENHRLLYPVSPTPLAVTNHAWLEANPLPNPGRIGYGRDSGVAAEAKHVLKGLLEVSTTLKPLQLQGLSETNADGPQSSWRPRRKTPQYLASQQREEFEKWTEWKEDLVVRALHGQRSKVHHMRGQLSEKSHTPQSPPRGQVVDGVEIVGASP
jgi:dynactin 1